MAKLRFNTIFQILIYIILTIFNTKILIKYTISGTPPRAGFF